MGRLERLQNGTFKDIDNSNKEGPEIIKNSLNPDPDTVKVDNSPYSEPTSPVLDPIPGSDSGGKKKSRFVIPVCIGILLSAIGGGSYYYYDNVWRLNERYEKASGLMEERKYDEAISSDKNASDHVSIDCWYYVSTKNDKGIKLRREPSTDSDVLAYVPYKTELYATDYSEEWIKTSWNGIDGWMSTVCLTEIK